MGLAVVSDTFVRAPSRGLAGGPGLS